MGINERKLWPGVGWGKGRALGAVLLLGLLRPGELQAAEVSVPLSLQVSLVAKVARFERGMAARGGDRVVVLILEKRNSVESKAVAGQLFQRFEELAQITGKSVDVVRVVFTTPGELAQYCQTRSAAMLYFAPGFERDEIKASVESLGTAAILTITSVASNVTDGVVLGFDLVSGKPKLLVNLVHARRQRLDFESELLKLVRVVE